MDVLRYFELKDSIAELQNVSEDTLPVTDRVAPIAGRQH